MSSRFQQIAGCLMAVIGISSICAVKVSAGTLFWGQVGNGQIVRADTDGTNIQTLVDAPIIRPRAVALDLVNRKVVWAEAGLGATRMGLIQRSDFDGSNIEDLVTSEIEQVTGLAIAASAGQMYWTDSTNGWIRRADLDGSNVVTLVTGQRIPHGIALDLSAGKMYWCEANDDVIRRANLDGTGIEDLVSTDNEPREIELDVARGKMYWVDAASGEVLRANLDGTGQEVLATTGYGTPYGLALDLLNDKVYWSSFDARGFPHSITRANLDGSAFEVVIDSGISFPQTLAIDPSIVQPPGNAPVAGDDTFSVQAGQTLSVGAPGVLNNDSDPDGDPITAVLAIGPAEDSSFVLNPDGSFDYTPRAGFAGTDTFTYTASDGALQSNAATVTITVIGTPPVAGDDAFQVQSGQVLTVSPPGVLGNDADAEGDPLTAVLVSGPTNAAVFGLNPNGSFSYTPNVGFTGTDTFTYQADDGDQPSTTATVTITVVPDPLDCLNLLAAIVDGYESLADSTVAQQLPAIQALLDAGDLSGATALQQATVATLVQEAGLAASSLSTECANCDSALQASGNAALIPTLNNTCAALMHRIGSIQAGAVAQLESAINPPDPTRVTLALRDGYVREIDLNASRAIVSFGNFTARYVDIIDRQLAAGDTAAADATLTLATQVLQRTSAARVGRIQQLCDNFVARAERRPGSFMLIAEVTSAANRAMFNVQVAEAESLRAIQAARASG